MGIPAGPSRGTRAGQIALLRPGQPSSCLSEVESIHRHCFSDTLSPSFVRQAQASVVHEVLSVDNVSGDPLFLLSELEK